jgi:hypothetical protein
VTFVPLQNVRDGAGRAARRGQELGVRDDGRRPQPSSGWRSRGADGRDLIVLDNFEQVIAAAPQVTALLTELPARPCW